MPWETESDNQSGVLSSQLVAAIEGLQGHRRRAVPPKGIQSRRAPVKTAGGKVKVLWLCETSAGCCPPARLVHKGTQGRRR